MSSATVFDIISLKLNKVLAQDLIPRFCEAAVGVASNFGEEPPSKDSMQVLFEDAFKKILETPRKKTSSPKTEKATKQKQPTEKATKQKKERKVLPKPKWATKKEMEDILIENEGQKYYCAFVADRGPNKGKFCACELTEEAKNCGEMSDEREWTPHTPEEEFKAVDGLQRDARCKACWSVGKSGAYRKVGGYDKLYNVAEKPESPKKKSRKKEPEIPEIPNEDVTEPEVGDKKEQEATEELIETDDKYEQCTDEEEPDGDDDDSTEDILDGLLDK